MFKNCRSQCIVNQKTSYINMIKSMKIVVTITIYVFLTTQ